MRISLGLLLVAACGSSSPRVPVAPVASGGGVHKVIVVLGRASGHYDEVKLPDGSLKITLDILANGRGPHVDGVMKLDEDGSIISFESTGHHEMGNKSAEKFSVSDGIATWDSAEEHGRADFAEQFYNPLSETPSLQFIVKAGLKAGGKVRLLPAGQADVAKVSELTVTANGRSKKIIGYGVTGLDFMRSYTWFNEDGSWFGTFSSWQSTCDEEWIPAIDPIVKEQERLDRELDQQTYTANAQQPPAAGLALTHARVLDVEKGAYIDDQTVVVVGDVIKAVGPSAKTAVPDGAKVIDLGGQSLLPGMIDMHSHTDKISAVLDIASGVTTVRDVGNNPVQLDDWKAQFDGGKAVGPRIVRMGFIEGRNEKAAPSLITAETPDEARAAVDYYAKRGWDGIKIYNSMRTELVPILTEEAHKRGMLVTGHVPVHMIASEAVKAGYDGIEHINQVALNFFATKDTDTRTPLRFTLVGDKVSSLDLTSKPVKDFIALLLEHHTVIDPTLIAFQDLYLAKAGQILPGWDKYVSRMPAQVQRVFLVNGLPGGEEKRELYAQAWQKLLAMVKAFHDAKVTLVIGTDMIGGLAYDRELELFSQAGVPNAAVLQMATLGAARAMKLDGKLGSIAPGKVADLVVVAGDPLKTLADVANVKMTVSRGVVFSSDPLFQAVGTAPASASKMGSGAK